MVVHKSLGEGNCNVSSMLAHNPPPLLRHSLPLAPYTGRASKDLRGSGPEVCMKSLLKNFLVPSGLVARWGPGLVLRLFLLLLLQPQHP